MTITLKQARPLCTKSEIELVEWSTPKRVKELDATRLRQKLSRARKLRDKFRDLGDSQKRQIRGKEGRAARGGPAQDNRNTRLKQELFAETVERFESALDKHEAGAEKAAKKKAGKKVSKKTGTKTDTKSGATGSKKTGKKTGKKVAKKVSKKSSKKASAPAAEMTTKKVTKKAGKKVGKKVAKKASKKVTKATAKQGEKSGEKKGEKRAGKAVEPKTTRRASNLLNKQGAPQPTALNPEQGSTIEQMLAGTETQQNNIALTTISDDIRPKTKAMEIDKGGAKRFQGHVSARGRRTQAKRDAR